MTWVRLDDQALTHPKVLAVPLGARWVWLCSIAYCARYLTDGYVTAAAAVRLVVPGGATPQQVTQLVAAGLWEPADGGYRVHDYLDYQPTRDQVVGARAALRQARAEAGRAGGRAKAANRQVLANVANEAPQSGQNRLANVANGVANGLQNVRSPVPSSTSSSSSSSSNEPEVVTGGGGTGEGLGRRAATTPPARVPLEGLSEAARHVLDHWRRCQGRRAPPKLNPTQAAQLETAVVDLGLPRLLEAAEWAAGKGLGEFSKVLSAARTKRVRDEAPAPSPRPGRTPPVRPGLPNRAGSVAYCGCGRVYPAVIGACPGCGKPATAARPSSPNGR